MSKYNTKYPKNIKKINTTLWLDKLINELEKAKESSLWIHLEINISRMNWTQSMRFMIVYEFARLKVYPKKN